MSVPDPPISLDIVRQRIPELQHAIRQGEEHLARLETELVWYEEAIRLFGEDASAMRLTWA